MASIHGCGCEWASFDQRYRLDLGPSQVRARAAYVERSTGELVLGPPKSRAGRRLVGVPAAIIPALRDHLALYVGPGPGALLFTGHLRSGVREAGGSSR